MDIKNIAILFSGNGSNLENVYHKLHNKVFDNIKINICIAISSRDDAYGITRCKNIDLECKILSIKANKEEYALKLADLLRPYNIHLVVLAGFMRILGNNFISRYTTINIHPSILPLFKGANAIVDSYNSYMKIAGVSIHYVDSSLDGGELIMQDIIHKIDGEELDSFESRIHDLEYAMYPLAILKVLKCMI